MLNAAISAMVFLMNYNAVINASFGVYNRNILNSSKNYIWAKVSPGCACLCKQMPCLTLLESAKEREGSLPL